MYSSTLCQIFLVAMTTIMNEVRFWLGVDARLLLFSLRSMSNEKDVALEGGQHTMPGGLGI